MNRHKRLSNGKRSERMSTKMDNRETETGKIKTLNRTQTNRHERSNNGRTQNEAKPERRQRNWRKEGRAREGGTDWREKWTEITSKINFNKQKRDTKSEKNKNKIIAAQLTRVYLVLFSVYVNLRWVLCYFYFFNSRGESSKEKKPVHHCFYISKWSNPSLTYLSSSRTILYVIIFYRIGGPGHTLHPLILSFGGAR